MSCNTIQGRKKKNLIAISEKSGKFLLPRILYKVLLVSHCPVGFRSIFGVERGMSLWLESDIINWLESVITHA